MELEFDTVKHEIEPVFNEGCRILMLGTMPSPKSREVGFYYGNPQNRFWRVMAAVLDEETPEDIREKKAMLLKHGIALWDVLASCKINGASDASIQNAVPNDMTCILDVAPIENVFCTGAKSYELYRKYCEPETGIEAVKLPSTSPANAKMSLEKLIEAYSKALFGD